MKYCHQCGTQNENDAVFCASCGAKQTSALVTGNSSGFATSEPQPEIKADPVMPEAYVPGPLPQSGIPVPPNGPVSNLVKLKGYLIYIIMACFLYSMFSAVNINVTGGSYDGGDMDGMRGSFHYNGWHMLTGALPKFNVSEMRNGRVRGREYTNADLEVASIRSTQRALLRLPLYFRMPFYLLLIGLVCYFISIFGMEPSKNYFLNSFSKAISFIGVAGIVWIFGEFGVWADKIRSITSVVGERVSIDMDVNFSIGVWGLLLSLGFLLGEYMYNNIAPLFKNLKSIELKPVQNI
jgi:hypothetical protein